MSRQTSVALSKQGLDCIILNEPFHCPKCRYILCEPHRVTCCNQNFCDICISKVKEDKKPCPSCGNSKFDHRPNVDLHEVLLQFIVDCTNKCGWKGCLKLHDDHLNLNPPDDKWLEGCGKVDVPCIYCKSDVHVERRQKLTKNLEKIFETERTKGIHMITITVKGKWYNIGLELEVDAEILENVQAQYGDDQECCYFEMLKIWIESTKKANWFKLLSAIKKPEMELEAESLKVEKIVLCSKASDENVNRLAEQAKTIQKIYKTKRNELQLLVSKLKNKWDYLEDKKEELKKLKLSRNEVKLQGRIREELSELTKQHKKYEEKIHAIEKELQDGMEAKETITEQIGEGIRQLNNTKDRMNDCIDCLEKEIKNLEEEENNKLEARDLGKSDRTTYKTGDAVKFGVKLGAVGAAIGAGLAGATGVAGVVGTAGVVMGAGLAGAGGLIAVPVGVGVYWLYTYLRPKSDKELIMNQYTRLIKICINRIQDLKTQIDDCEKRLEELMDITTNLS